MAFRKFTKKWQFNSIIIGAGGSQHEATAVKPKNDNIKIHKSENCSNEEGLRES